MNKNFSLKKVRARYGWLAQKLTCQDWITEGYAQDRGPGSGGLCDQWTRKVRNKTFSVALSKKQYEWLKEAIRNWRTIQSILKEMQPLIRRVLFETVRNPPRRKRFGKNLLGII